MELARITHELWRRRFLVAAVAVASALIVVLTFYTVSLSPLGVRSRSLQYSAARAQILVDSSASSIGDVNRDLTPLIARANVLSRLMASPGVVNLIGQAAGIPGNQIDAKGPYEIDQPRVEQEPTAEARSNQIIGARNQYRVRFESNPALPLITVFTQAPTNAQAAALANGTARALTTYVDALQQQQQVAPAARVAVRQVGRAYGATVNPGTNKAVAVFMFLALCAIGVFAILAIPRFVASFRATREAAAVDAPLDDDGESLFADEDGAGDPRAERREPFDRASPTAGVAN